MRYQVLVALWGDTPVRHVLLYEREGKVFRFQSKRISYVQLPVQRLEDVTDEMVRVQGETARTPIMEAPDDTEPIEILRAYEEGTIEEVPAEEPTPDDAGR